MCILCGELITQIHWTESAKQSKHPTIVVGENQGVRRRNRLHQVELLNQILKHYGLQLSEWQGSKFILKNRQGKVAMVQDLGALWPEVEQMLGKPLDPLDPTLLAKLANETA